MCIFRALSRGAFQEKSRAVLLTAPVGKKRWNKED